MGAPQVPHGTSGTESPQDTFLETSGALTDWTRRRRLSSITRAPCRKVMGVPGQLSQAARNVEGPGGVPSGPIKSKSPATGGAWSLGDSTHWSVSRTSVVIAQQFSNLFPGAIQRPYLRPTERLRV
jgi:hypothetical protein